MKELLDQCRAGFAGKKAVLSGKCGSDLGAFLACQRKKLACNAEMNPLQSREDFFRICEEHLSGLLNEKDCRTAMEAVCSGAMHTADHLGGMYSPQSFQGDLLFGKMLAGEGGFPGLLPVFAFGSVSLEAETYARGILSFTSPSNPVKLPIFVSKYSNCAASLMPGFTSAMVKEALRLLPGFVGEAYAAGTIRRLLEEIYPDDVILSRERFADQVLFLGRKLTREALSGIGFPPVLYLEIEALCAELAVRDCRDGGSLLRLFLHDERLIRVLNRIRTEKGQPLSALLFRGADRNRRTFFLNLEKPGLLQGKTIGKENMQFVFDDETLFELLRSRKLLPGTYLCALLLAFARGLTWYGGIFQSDYLPHWQELTVTALREAGFPELSESVGRYDVSGYISGPVFALYDTGRGAANAGPVEFMIRKPDPSVWDTWMKTDIRSAHRMGMFEFYHDLVPSKDKKEGWYETIAQYAKEHCPENIL